MLWTTWPSRTSKSLRGLKVNVTNIFARTTFRYLALPDRTLSRQLFISTDDLYKRLAYFYSYLFE